MVLGAVEHPMRRERRTTISHPRVLCPGIERVHEPTDANTGCIFSGNSELSVKYILLLLFSGWVRTAGDGDLTVNCSTSQRRGVNSHSAFLPILCPPFSYRRVIG